MTCDRGTHTRTRLCDDPQAKNGGKNCVGDSGQRGVCEKRGCELGKRMTNSHRDTAMQTERKHRIAKETNENK